MDSWFDRGVCLVGMNKSTVLLFYSFCLLVKMYFFSLITIVCCRHEPLISLWDIVAFQSVVPPIMYDSFWVYPFLPRVFEKFSSNPFLTLNANSLAR